LFRRIFEDSVGYMHNDSSDSSDEEDYTNYFPKEEKKQSDCAEENYPYLTWIPNELDFLSPTKTTHSTHEPVVLRFEFEVPTSTIEKIHTSKYSLRLCCYRQSNYLRCVKLGENTLCKVNGKVVNSSQAYVFGYDISSQSQAGTNQ